jgi:HAD superfamily hydrolase (TIGR01509 family)
MRPRAGVVFDLDGVIVDSEELQYRAYASILAPLGVEIGRAEYAREWIAGGGGPEYAVRTYHLPFGAAELRRRKNPVYLEMLRREAALMPGAREALSRLGRVFALALATNSSGQEVELVLDRFGLRQAFAAVAAREDYREAKPAPDAFVAAAARLGLPAGRCVAVEDAERGVRAAVRAGCRCIAVPNAFTAGHDFALADAVVGDLDALTVSLVASLLPGGGSSDAAAAATARS